MADLKGKFTSRQEFAKYFGVMGVRVVVDERGLPIVNPSRAVLAEYLDGFDKEGDEKEYEGKSSITWGYTDLVAEGGMKRVKQEEFDKLSSVEQAKCIVEEVPYVKVSLLVETIEEAPKRKMITFRFFNAQNITKDGDKKKVFNKFGKTTYVTADGVYSNDKFERTTADMVRDLPMSTGHLDFEDLMNFLYAYSTLNRKEALLEEIDVEAILEGDVSSIISIIQDIHEGIVSPKGIPLYGAAVLFTVENNGGTNGEFRQSYYHVFERWFMDETLKPNLTFSQISRDIANERKPSAKDKKVYSPESKGIFVGVGGLPKAGLKEFKPAYMDNIMSQQASTSSRLGVAANGMSNKPEDNPFGVPTDDLVF